jgi:hypothetical protein
MRELTREGIEPNPGPTTWTEIYSEIKSFFGVEWTPEHEALTEINGKIRSHCKLDLAPSTDEHVAKYFLDTSDQHPMRPYIEEAIIRIKKSTSQGKDMTIRFLRS